MPVRGLLLRRMPTADFSGFGHLPMRATPCGNVYKPAVIKGALDKETPPPAYHKNNEMNKNFSQKGKGNLSCCMRCSSSQAPRTTACSRPLAAAADAER